MAPERIWKWGGHLSGAKRQKNFLIVPLHFFGSKSTNSRVGERFRNGQCSLVSCLFTVLLLTVPLVPYGAGATGDMPSWRNDRKGLGSY